eukprot:7557277-Lingulodinium_polyedra.AAC.1
MESVDLLFLFDPVPVSVPSGGQVGPQDAPVVIGAGEQPQRPIGSAPIVDPHYQWVSTQMVRAATVRSEA